MLISWASKERIPAILQCESDQSALDSRWNKTDWDDGGGGGLWEELNFQAINNRWF